jgi:probable F420-dependent oxidoreductase
MELGVMQFVTDLSIGPVELAQAVEASGLGSLFLPEHTHIPTGRATPYPAGGPLPEEYRRTYDPFVGLAAAAAATTTLRVGTGICLVAQHDPILLAKEVASLDLVSGGRFLFGIGFGWNVDEMQHHGVDAPARRAIVREKVLAMKALWTQDEASFDGEHVRFAPSWSWPKPVQQPHPPVLLGGGAGPTLLRHVVEYCDGWMPIGGSGLKTRLPELRQLAEEAGRDPDSIEITVFGARPDPSLLEHYASMGIARVVLPLPSEGADVVLPILDHYAKLVPAVAGYNS